MGYREDYPLCATCPVLQILEADKANVERIEEALEMDVRLADVEIEFAEERLFSLSDRPADMTEQEREVAQSAARIQEGLGHLLKDAALRRINLRHEMAVRDVDPSVNIKYYDFVAGEIALRCAGINSKRLLRGDDWCKSKLVDRRTSRPH